MYYAGVIWILLLHVAWQEAWTSWFFYYYFKVFVISPIKLLMSSIILGFMALVLIAFHRYYTLRGNRHQEKSEKTVKFPEILPCIPITAWNRTTSLSVPTGWGLPWASKAYAIQSGNVGFWHFLVWSLDKWKQSCNTPLSPLQCAWTYSPFPVRHGYITQVFCYGSRRLP